MNLSLALLLSASLPVHAAPANNLNFHTGTLGGWEGKGFYVTTGTSRGPNLTFGVSSSDLATPGNKAVLHCTIAVPSGGGVLRCRAAAVRKKDAEPNANLNVVLMAAGRKVLPMKVRGLDKEGYSAWLPARAILPAVKGKPREYLWDLSYHAGQTLRLALQDDDDRPGCHLHCAGIRLLPGDDYEVPDFKFFMHKLVKDNKLPEIEQYESRRFVALSNAGDEFTFRRLMNCELIYDEFLEHFQKMGFRLRPPSSKMMVAVFENRAGFQSFIGEPLPLLVTGFYHFKKNTLVVYDVGTNEGLVAQKRLATVLSKRIPSQMHRKTFLDTVYREVEEIRKEANISTVMHEVAHQLSYNCGLLNRDADIPLWLSEGMACYCEATENGTWQGIGENNPDRIQGLIPPPGVKGWIALEDLVGSNGWLHGKDGPKLALLGYSQSWALFRMLMEERPEPLRRFLAMIYNRKTDHHRLADFAAAFGDVKRLQLRYGEYMRKLVDREIEIMTTKVR